MAGCKGQAFFRQAAHPNKPRQAPVAMKSTYLPPWPGTLYSAGRSALAAAHRAARERGVRCATVHDHDHHGTSRSRSRVEVPEFATSLDDHGGGDANAARSPTQPASRARQSARGKAASTRSTRATRGSARPWHLGRGAARARARRRRSANKRVDRTSLRQNPAEIYLPTSGWGAPPV